MSFIAIMLSLSALPFSLFLLPWVARLASPLHAFCHSIWSSTAHFSINSALICGESISDSLLRDQLMRSGLYHLVVVSGAHLLWLEALAHKCLPTRLRFLTPGLLALFCLVSDWQAPVVRAWIQSLFRLAHSTSPTQCLWQSWIFCLALHPQWIHSLSLHLSVLASLALIPRRGDALLLALQVLLFLMPVLIGWAPVHPSVALAAVLLALPSLILWLITAAMELFVPRGFWIWNEILEFWQQILIAVGSWQAPLQAVPFGPSRWAWAYTLIAILVVHALRVNSERRKTKGLSR